MSNKELNSVIDKAEDEYQKLKDKVVEQGLEIERLNNIIKRLGTDLYNMYITFGEFSEEYTENRIKKLKEGGDSEDL